MTGNGDVLLENLHLIPATIYTLMMQRNGAKTVTPENAIITKFVEFMFKKNHYVIGHKII